jgi:pyruvate-formate lyase-activating enzyme
MPSPAPRDALCILPWIHLEVVPEGNTKICCVAREAVRDKGHPMNVASSSLEEIRSSQYLRSVRSALADGRKIPVCAHCWEQEQRGEGSERQIWNGIFTEAVNTLQARLEEGAEAAEPMPLQYLQISVGNKCNLACRMCNASYSSRIAEDPVHSKWAPAMDREGTVGGVGENARRSILARQGPPPRPGWVEGTPWFEQPAFVEKDMMGAGSTLKMLYVTGGEPFFVPAFDRILDDYVARGLARDMVISLNTNLFHNERRIARAMESLLRFKYCHLAPSIDGHGAVYEYIRYPAKWDIVERNIRFVADLRRQRENLYVMLTTVAQAYNCFNLPELLSFADELSLECKPHVLDGPPQLRPQVLPRELRLRAAEGLSAYAATPADPGPRTANRGHAARIARYLERCEETADLAASRRKFVAFTRDLDAARGQSLERSVPELREMMTLFA